MPRTVQLQPDRPGHELVDDEDQDHTNLITLAPAAAGRASCPIDTLHPQECR
jgi:hypothetical protein